MYKGDDIDFMLGGRGMDIEFCIFCCSKRACDCDLGPNEICLEHFLQTKANIGGFQGLRDDLTCLLDEDISSICLCELHCEMHNTEQVLRSVGLYAYKVGSLKEMNVELRKYGPENFKTDRITVKLKPEQATCVDRNNIAICSFSGGTERQILNNIEDIVEEALPVTKVEDSFKDPDSAKHCILNKITFCQERVKHYQKMLDNNVYIRDHGTRLEEITLNGTAVYKKLITLHNYWIEKREEVTSNFRKCYVPQKSKKQKSKKRENRSNELTSYAASLTIDFYKQVCVQWRDIALTMRSKTFSEEEEPLIDIFDVQVKEDLPFLGLNVAPPLLTNHPAHQTLGCYLKT